MTRWFSNQAVHNMNNLLSFSKSLCSVPLSFTRVVFISLTEVSFITERSLYSEMPVACTQLTFYFACQHCDKEWSRINSTNFEWKHFLQLITMPDSNYTSETSASSAWSASWTHPGWGFAHYLILNFEVLWDIWVSCDGQVLQQTWLIKQKPTMQISWRKKITLANGDCTGRRWMLQGFTFDWEKRSRDTIISSSASS